MMTIANGWSTYVERVVPAAASDGQKRDLKRAFYAGAHQTMLNMSELSGTLSEDDAVVAIEAMHVEMDHFASDIKAGKA